MLLNGRILRLPGCAERCCGMRVRVRAQDGAAGTPRVYVVVASRVYGFEGTRMRPGDVHGRLCEPVGVVDLIGVVYRGAAVGATR